MRHLGLPQSFYPLLDLSHTFPPRRSTRLAKDVLPDKNEDAWTTSSRFKLDLVEPCWPSIYPLVD
jgi:hypothetical protein